MYNAPVTAIIVNYGTPDLTRAAAWSLRSSYWCATNLSLAAWRNLDWQSSLDWHDLASLLGYMLGKNGYPDDLYVFRSETLSSDASDWDWFFKDEARA